MSTITEEYVNFVSQYAALIAVSIDEIKEHSRKDDTLSALKVLILCGEWFRIADVTKQFKSCNIEDLEIYKRFKEELTISADGSILLLRNRLIIPPALESKIIRLAHESHFGMSKTKNLLLDKVYFPRLDQKVETLISPCISSIKYTFQD